MGQDVIQGLKSEPYLFRCYKGIGLIFTAEFCGIHAYMTQFSGLTFQGWQLEAVSGFGFSGQIDRWTDR